MSGRLSVIASNATHKEYVLRQITQSDIGRRLTCSIAEINSPIVTIGEFYYVLIVSEVTLGPVLVI